MNFGTPGWGCDARAAAEIMRVYRDAGGNFVDTADIYGAGESERIVGRLVTGARDEFVIASKVGFRMPGATESAQRPETIRWSIEETLTRLRIDHLDLYQLHCYDPRVPLEEVLGALDALADAGLIRYAGCSNFFAWQIAYADTVAQSRDLRRFVSAQMMYNLVRRDIEREHVECAREIGVSLIAYSPLHGGQLAGGWTSREQLPAESRTLSNPDVYLADEERLFNVTRAVVAHATSIDATPGQVALAWVMRQPWIAATLTAARSAAELQSQLGALTLDVDASFWSSLDDATGLAPSYPTDFYERLQARRD